MDRSTTLCSIAVAAAALAAAGCDDLHAASELDRPRVLAVRVDPPHVTAGGQARLDALVGDGDGRASVIAPATVTVAALEPPAQVPDGMIERGRDGWTVRCPDEVALAALRQERALGDGEPIPVPLDLEVAVDGEPLSVTKTVYLGSERANPVVAGLALEAATADADGVLVAPAGGELDLVPDGADGVGPLAYAWYSSVGPVVAYRSEAAALDAAAPAEGQIALVVRDQRGGVSWTVADVRLE